MQLRERRILRYVLAVTTGFTVAQLVNWQLAYIMPVLLSMLMTGPQINLKSGLIFVAVIAGGCMIGLLLSMTIVDYPVVCLLVFSILLMHIYSAGNRNLPPFAVTMLMMGILIIPLIGIPSIKLSTLLVEALIRSGLIAVAIALFFFTLLPTEGEPPPAPKKASGPQLSPETAGVISTIVILPLLIYFYSFSVTSAIVVLVFSAILASNVDLATTTKGAAVLVIANAFGGVFAVVIYNLLVMAPWWPFMAALIGLAATFFASRIFSDRPTAQLYSTAFTAVLLLVGVSVSSDSADAAEKFISRILQLFAAGFYVVVMFTLLKKLSQYLRRGRVAPDLTNVKSDASMVSDIGA